ncbi:hypothetical protein MLD38_009718 [Melastoma candidum]|uniref:Uncharacterized protein n=1 Tax=Melastoma candidum TaxID=119954 RepID=A0ACB9RXW5_9MYRT|nr:hypothetical protein MLD38_009718 [Melastoma candidum]
MESARTLAAAAGVGVRRRRPLADCTNSLVPDDSSSTSSASLPKKTSSPLLHSSVDGAGAEAVGGALKSAAHHNRHRAVKRKCPPVTMMTVAPAIGDSSGSLDEAKNRNVSKAVVLPDKREQLTRLMNRTVIDEAGWQKQQRVRRGGRPSKESDQALEDYFRQQRTYFAEVDAFELEEEEVDEAGALE